MIVLKLAFRNLIGAGLRTWLNVVVLSMSFVVIIWQQGLLDGWNQQARRDTIEWEIGGGQYWHKNYDPYDPFTIEDSHGLIPAQLLQSTKKGQAAPVLVAQASIYPQGRIQNVLLKGIYPDQKVIQIPTDRLKNKSVDLDVVPAVIGTRMAKSTHLHVGDYVTVRWRDTNGTFDATEIQIVQIMKTNVGTVDFNQLWLPFDQLQKMMQTPDQATLVIMAQGHENIQVNGWIFRDHDFLLRDIKELIKSKTVGGMVLYFLLLFLAWIAIFDTQVLSIFRRRKEIGTLIALGMTRSRVVTLFTLEGSMHSILAALMAAVYGIPLLRMQAMRGFSMPEMTDNMGLAIADKIFPVYGAGLVLGTTIIVMISVTIVSLIPARKIATMKPTDAIKGKIS